MGSLTHVFTALFLCFGYVHFLLHFLILETVGQAICLFFKLLKKYPVDVIVNNVIINNEILTRGAIL